MNPIVQVYIFIALVCYVWLWIGYFRQRKSGMPGWAAAGIKFVTFMPFWCIFTWLALFALLRPVRNIYADLSGKKPVYQKFIIQNNKKSEDILFIYLHNAKSNSWRIARPEPYMMLHPEMRVAPGRADTALIALRAGDDRAIFHFLDKGKFSPRGSIVAKAYYVPWFTTKIYMDEFNNSTLLPAVYPDRIESACSFAMALCAILGGVLHMLTIRPKRKAAGTAFLVMMSILVATAGFQIYFFARTLYLLLFTA